MQIKRLSSFLSEASKKRASRKGTPWLPNRGHGNEVILSLRVLFRLSAPHTPEQLNISTADGCICVAVRIYIHIPRRRGTHTQQCYADAAREGNMWTCKQSHSDCHRSQLLPQPPSRNFKCEQYMYIYQCAHAVIYKQDENLKVKSTGVFLHRVLIRHQISEVNAKITQTPWGAQFENIWIVALVNKMLFVGCGGTASECHVFPLSATMRIDIRHPWWGSGARICSIKGGKSAPECENPQVLQAIPRF